MKRITILLKIAFCAAFFAALTTVPQTAVFAQPEKSAKAKLPDFAQVMEVPSAAMQKSLPATVILPDSYKASPDRRYPVIYLLHGAGGNHLSWLHYLPNLGALASSYNVIIVCPNGALSWYWDSPVDPKMKYETFVSKELVQFIDAHYRTKASRRYRAITGLSMGGQGGLWLGIRHQDTFGACGSMSGGVDIRSFPNNWGMSKMLGEYSKYPQNWENHTIESQLHLITPNSIRIVIECGTSDFFYRVNEKLHQEMLYRNIAHDYTTRPGIHNWDYWRNALPYQLHFFSLSF